MLIPELLQSFDGDILGQVFHAQLRRLGRAHGAQVLAVSDARHAYRVLFRLPLSRYL